MQIITTIGAAHLKRVDRANRRQIRKMAATAVHKACVKIREQGFKPLTLVDDLSMHSIGNWIDDFAYGLTAAAKREGVSIVGGEMAQMSGAYHPHSISVVIFVVGIKSNV